MVGCNIRDRAESRPTSSARLRSSTIASQSPSAGAPLLNLSLPLDPIEIGAHPRRDAPARLREIPYNYTSFSDREIVIRLLGAAGLAHPR